jgi:hypothetical protein
MSDCIVPVYGHAVHSAAMAYLMAKSLGLDSTELDKILDFVHVCLDDVCGGGAGYATISSTISSYEGWRVCFFRCAV